MASSLHPVPDGTSSSATSSNPRYTPVSGSDEEPFQSSPSRPPPGSLKLQTDFVSSRDVGPAGDPASDNGDSNAYDSPEKLQQTRSQPARSAQYSMAEERQVIRGFDRKLVPFLGLLYLLSFLDRSSMSAPFGGSLLTIARYRKCKNCRSCRGSKSLIRAI